MPSYHLRVALEVTDEGEVLLREARGLDQEAPLLETVRDEVHGVLTGAGAETGYWSTARVT